MKPRHPIPKSSGAGKHKDLRKTRGKRVPIDSIQQKGGAPSPVPRGKAE